MDGRMRRGMRGKEVWEGSIFISGSGLEAPWRSRINAVESRLFISYVAHIQAESLTAT